MKPQADRAAPPLTLLVPSGFDSVVTGGNIYDRRLLQALRDAGVDAEVVEVSGNWPHPDAAEQRELAAALRRDDPILIDGLMAAGCPDVVEKAVADGTDVRVLVHMPLALDPMLDAATAALLDDLERRTLQAANGVICTSAWAADEIRRRHRVEAAVAEPGVDPAPAAVGSVPPRIVQVGTIGPLKNQLATVTALAALTRFDWSARLVGPVGDSDYADAVSDIIRKAGLEHRVLVMGQLGGAELAQQWAEADLSVLPSKTETYGMVVAESLAHAVPAVVSAGTGAENTLGGDSTGNRPGFVVDTSTAEPLTAALADWLQDESLRRRVKASAEDRRTMLTGWETTAAAVLKTLQ